MNYLGVPAAPRSVLFVPGNKPELIEKLARVPADVVVVDLEDAVPKPQKEMAREAAAKAIRSVIPGLPSACFVRLNESGSPWYASDLEVAISLGIAGVVLPKYEEPGQLESLRKTLAARGRSDMQVMVGLESAIGVEDCRTLFAAGPDQAYFGAEDLIADLGGYRTAENMEVLYARSRVSIAAKISRISLVDQAVVDFRDDERFLRDAEQGRALGYAGKICIHPRQVELCSSVFGATDDSVAFAMRVLAAAAKGVAVVDGQMVDEVHVKMANQILARRLEP